MTLHFTLLLIAVLVVAFLYSSVGHGGASGYLAVMALAGLPPAAMAQTALCLNLLVAGLSFYSFRRAGHFQWRLFWPFALASIPLAFLGGALRIGFKTYAVLFAVTMIFAGFRLLMPLTASDLDERPLALPAALGAGGGIGLLSGIVGVGGGIFLSPLMILMRWADTKRVAAVSALFILVNSVAGLAGHLMHGAGSLYEFWPLAAAAFAGGLLGSKLGADRFGEATLRRLLGIVLFVAAAKMLQETGRA